MNYPKVIFTYVDTEGKETSLSSENILGCCAECELQKIVSVFDDFIGCIINTVAAKYPEEEEKDDDEDDEETKVNKANFDRRFFGNHDDDDKDDNWVGLTD
jgi:hypothetical protein